MAHVEIVEDGNFIQYIAPCIRIKLLIITGKIISISQPVFPKKNY